VRLIDGSLFMMPRTGVFTSAGVNMEKQGVVPDFTVEPNPDELARGIDRQLEKAVEVLQEDVAQWKKTRPSRAFHPGVMPSPAPGTVVHPPAHPVREPLPQPVPASGARKGE
jgi:C-terminal processing protease CtpA/Prc